MFVPPFPLLICSEARAYVELPRCLGTFSQLGFCVAKGQAGYADNGGMRSPDAHGSSRSFMY